MTIAAHFEKIPQMVLPSSVSFTPPSLIAIQFSGGKDSLALMYQCRDLIEAGAPVYFACTGDTFPHTLVHEVCDKLRANLRIVRPARPIAEFQAEKGLPVDLLPLRNLAELQVYEKTPKPLLQAYATCCSANLWEPMHQALVRDGISLALRGNKSSDNRVYRERSGHLDGVEYWSPLWDWTDRQVFAYLRQQGISPAQHYSHINHSFDCIHCTAFLSDKGGRERLQYVRDKYPAAWPELRRRLQVVKSALQDELGPVAKALAVVDD